MQHDHIAIAVLDSDPPGSEAVPAVRIEGDQWELLESPLYATQVAAGDVLKVLDPSNGTFEIMTRGGNLCVQFYLSPDKAECQSATTEATNWLDRELTALGGRIDGRTTGLISCTVPASAGFGVVEKVFNVAAEKFSGAQWQYGNVYDPASGEPIGWWNTE